MDADKKAKVEEYIDKNEKTKGFGKITETVAELTGVEEETKDSFLSKWLKNDKNLLSYAELTMKTEKLNFGESFKQGLLELKLSITCPYFADFKDFLKELKLGPDTSRDNTATSTRGSTKSTNTATKRATSMTTTTTTTNIETISEISDISVHKFCGTDINNIESEPFDKNNKTGNTWCSKTARLNGYNFGLNLPSGGDAFTAGTFPGKDSIQTIPSDKINRKPQNFRKGIQLNTLRGISKGNYADIYTSGKTGYGHRVAAFKDDSGQRYVLDPYTRVNGKLDNSPKKLEDYMKFRKIVKAHIYKSRGYKKVKG